MPEKSVIPELDAVYKKWEHRGPKGHTVTADRSLAQEEEGVTKRAERAIESGKKKWREKFGSNMEPIQRRQTRDRRRIVAVPVESVQLNAIAKFKLQPIVQPEEFMTNRPLQGQCCSCMANSQKDLITPSTRLGGIRNLMDLRQAVRGCGPLAQQFPALAYVIQRRTDHIYPKLSMKVLAHSRVKEAIQEELANAKDKTAVAKFEKKATDMLAVMQAIISNTLTKLSAWTFIHVLEYLGIGIQVHKGQMKMLETAHQRGLPIVYLPLHRSHLDYIVISHVMWNYNLPNPFIAAGDNLNMFFFGSVMRHLGGFFIRRKLDSGSRKDAIYRAVLHTYIEQLLAHGQTVEFFLEGGRSRTGKSLQPKGGLLSVVIDSIISGTVEDALVVPISISYERILDGNFIKEQMGIPKKRETFFGAIKGLWKTFRCRYGNLRADFAQPFSLRECMQACQPAIVSTSSPESSSSEMTMSSSPPLNLYRNISTNSLYGTDVVAETQRQLVNSVGQHVVYTCVQTTAIMSTNLLAFLLLTIHRQGGKVNELARDFAWLRDEIVWRKRDVGFAATSDLKEVVLYAAQLLGDGNIQIKTDKPPSDTVLVPTVDTPSVFELSYYSNAVISVFLLESILVNTVIYLSEITLATIDSGCPIEVVLMTKDEILEAAIDLCTLLKYEFIYVPPCKQLEEVLADALDSLVISEILKQEEAQQFDTFNTTFDKQWATRLSHSLSWAEDGDEEEETYKQEELLRINLERPECVKRLRFFHKVLAPYFEAYFVTGHHVKEKMKAEIPEDDFIRSLHTVTKDRVTQGTACYGESAALETLKMAMRSYKSMKIVYSYSAGSLQMLGLHSSQSVREKLDQQLHKLKALTQ